MNRRRIRRKQKWTNISWIIVTSNKNFNVPQTLWGYISHWHRRKNHYRELTFFSNKPRYKSTAARKGIPSRVLTLRYYIWLKIYRTFTLQSQILNNSYKELWHLLIDILLIFLWRFIFVYQLNTLQLNDSRAEMFIFDCELNL